MPLSLRPTRLLPRRRPAPAADDGPAVVAMHGVGRQYGGLAAVDAVTFDVPKGTILGIIGPSGSGKTTLIRMLTGTLKPTSGAVRVLGEDPLRFRRRTRERIGYMPQQFVLYPELTAAENVAFVGSLFGLLWKRRRQRVRAVLELVELWDARGRRASQLSGGMQRRLELACALVHEPTLLFVDEPTAGLDPLLRETIWEEFRRLRDEGRTLLVTTQYVGEAEHCDRVAVLTGGKLIALAEPDKLRRDALGGDVLEVETGRAVDGQLLADLPEILEVRQPTPRRLLLTTSEAGAATPRVLEKLAEEGIPVVSSSEYRPSFDEVFAELVARTQSGASADGVTDRPAAQPREAATPAG